MKKQRTLAPGIWMDHERGLHLSVPDILAAVGLPDTEENRRIVIREAQKFMAENLPKVPTRVQCVPKAWEAWWPMGGPCAVCGTNDARHRIWDAIVDRWGAGDAPAVLALDYGVPVEAIDAVLAGWQRTDEGCR